MIGWFIIGAAGLLAYAFGTWMQEKPKGDRLEEALREYRQAVHTGECYSMDREET